MKTELAANRLVPRAAEALKAVLAHVSAITIKELRCIEAGPRRPASILAYIDVYGHSRVLACTVKADTNPRHLRMALDGLRASSAQFKETVIPILIAPYLSPETRAVCDESHAGFLDLEGNARLLLGEVFIVLRSMQHEQPASKLIAARIDDPACIHAA